MRCSRTRPVLGLIALISAFTTLTACGVPPEMQIAHSNDPQYRDENAVFRATYYFRVFDVCQLETQRIAAGAFINNQGQTKVLLSDSLYRYTMTGKADSLTNRIKFESGVLKAQEIDPFGAQVAFDRQNNQFYVKSSAQVQQEARTSETFAAIDRLIDLRDSLPKDASGQVNATAAAQIDAAIQKQLVALGGDLAPEDQGGGSGIGTTGSAASGAMSADKCAQSNGIVRRGFQIMGPEAVKTYDQDDRLILAMTTSAQPLISTIKDISSRLTSTRPATAAQLQPLADERVRILQAERAVDQASASSGSTAATVVDAAINGLDAGGQP